MTAIDSEQSIRALSHQSTNQKVLDLTIELLAPDKRVLDLGAGEGYFAKLLGDHIERAYGVRPATLLTACDVTPGLFKYKEVPCDMIGPDGKLPYPDGSFDIVCSLEVVEHVQDQFLYCREILRVLKPGGIAIISTPNVLNINSRYRIMHSGFATMFNPLALSSRDVVHTSGHIHPVSYYYLGYALLAAGARSVRVEYDRFKRSALLPLLLFSPILLLGNVLFRAKLRRKSPQVYRENASLLRDVRSWRMLRSRSIVVVVER
jgi:SAM-dependent methyltransferase